MTRPAIRHTMEHVHSACDDCAEPLLKRTKARRAEISPSDIFIIANTARAQREDMCSACGREWPTLRVVIRKQKNQCINWPHNHAANGCG